METLNTMPYWEREKAYEKMYDEELDKVIELENKIFTINKGIDELIEYFNNKLNENSLQRYPSRTINCEEVIGKLKKLKGE